MNVIIKGTLKIIFQEQQVNDRLSKKEIVVTTDEDTKYPQDLIVQALNREIEKLDPFKMGQMVQVTADLRGRESNGRYYNQLVLRDISLSK